ncbi:hypothetical protein A2985_00705 [Candidatus Woesebacteria bacterium RIFCSPLOWO2_01_FULL_43_11]|nr:MAG: hypothetical protein A2985_00705 [Candidatus Woesebacteria bacterium RIFCSPLOWO2_01_FULL_43_11]
MKKKVKIVAVLIAYKAEATLAKFWADFPRKYFDEIILVDDASGDKTFEIAKTLSGQKAYQNSVNLGYGGNLKRAVAIALNHGADIIVDIHPDGEYKPAAIPPALEKIQKEGYEFVLGNRFTRVDTPLKSGMYAWKVLPLVALSYIDRLVLGVKITDFHQGFRVYTRKLFENVNFVANSNNYLFSFELITQSAFNNIRVAEVPVETNYIGEKRGASLKSSIKYSVDTFRVLALYLLAKIGIKTKIFNRPKGDLQLRISGLI